MPFMRGCWTCDSFYEGFEMSEIHAKGDPIPSWVAPLALAAVIAAAIPNYFFTTPFRLYTEGTMKGFYGLSIWAPALLAAAAFFAGVDYFDRQAPARRSLDAATIFAPLLWILFVSQWFPGQWQTITMPNWDMLLKAMPLYGALFAMQVLFFQGMLQQYVLGTKHRFFRAFLPGIVAGLILLPCARHMVDFQTAFQEFLLPAFVHQSILSGLIESGATLLRVMGVAFVMGVAWIYFQQGIF